MGKSKWPQMKRAIKQSKKQTKPVRLASFGPGVMLSAGEPWFAEANTEHPTSIWSATVALKTQDEEAWRMIARDLFELRRKKDAALLLPEAVLFMAAETNRADDHGAWLAVWIDDEGKYKLKVWLEE